ncbi:hypothetical protein HYFRA_00002592 [Hymenoscyphus fraxineus]|uniref:Uncharacterized protein n=1 Tax=Hymenoscyphus fraxineus TaxID=746836 RepID=A0A9N9L9M2_9HELO|nr:hypothetical protein HYFRA_00002592 [Hymenoscyphus fraxineus]
MAPSSMREMLDKHDQKMEGDSSSQYSRTSTAHNASASVRSHPAIRTEDGGRVLHVNIYFTPSSETTLYREYEGKKYIEPGNLLEILGDYPTFAHFVTLCIYFQPSINEPVELKKEQGKFIEDLAGVMNSFYRIRKLDVGLSLPTFSWGQMKNAASFYPLRFTRWSLHQKLGNKEWVEVQPNSNLQRRLNGYVMKFLEEQEKDSGEKTERKPENRPTHRGLPHPKQPAKTKHTKQTKKTGKEFRQSRAAKQDEPKKKGRS